MQPVTEILKEIAFPIWMVWGVSIFALTMSTIATIRVSEGKTLLASIPVTGLTTLIVTMGMILYFANDSIGRRKERDQEIAKWKKEMAAMKTSWSKEKAERMPDLDSRLQSVEGIIGYLDQSIKTEHKPKNLVPIILFLAKEIKAIRDEKQ